MKVSSMIGRYIQTGEEVMQGHLRSVLKHLKDCHVEEGVGFFFVELESQMLQRIQLTIPA